jgi:hypothetical protein
MMAHWDSARRKVVVVLSLLSTLLLLATVLQCRQRSEQTLEQQVSFSVPQLLDQDHGLNISISLGPIHPSDSSGLNNRTEESGPSTGEEQGNSENSKTIQWDSREEVSAAHEARGEHVVLEPSFQAPLAFETRSTHMEYPQEVRPIRIAINTQPRQSTPVYAYDIGNAYDTGQEPPPPPPPPRQDFFASGQDSSPPPLLPSYPPPPLPSQQDFKGDASRGDKVRGEKA